MLSRRHAFPWTSFIVVSLILFTDTSNGSKSILHPQTRSSISSPVQYLTNVNGSPKLLKSNQSASNGQPWKALGVINTMTQKAKTSAIKHNLNFEKQMLAGVSTRKTTRIVTIVTQREKSTTAKQNIEKVGLFARKNHIQINLNRNINQARRNQQKSILNTQIQIVSNYNPQSRNARTNNMQNPAPSVKGLTTTRPRHNNISNNKNSGLNTEGNVMNQNLPETVHMSVGHASNSNPQSSYDANMLDYKKVTDGKIKIRKHQVIISNAVPLNKTVFTHNTQSKKPLFKPTTSRSLGMVRSTTPYNVMVSTDPPGGSTYYSRNTDPLHAFFPDYGFNQRSSSPSSNMTTNDENEGPLNKTEMINFREKMKRAVTLNDNKDIPRFLFNCLPNEVIDCESDENFNYVVESLLQKPESLKDDLDLMQKIYTRLQQVNITWPEGYAFNEREFATLVNDSMVTSDVKTRPQSDDLSVVKKYKFIQGIFSSIASAPHKPGDIFITDVVKEIIKIKSTFVKRKILDLLFYKILHPSYVDDKDTANDHNDDDVSEVPNSTTEKTKDNSDSTDEPRISSEAADVTNNENDE